VPPTALEAGASVAAASAPPPSPSPAAAADGQPRAILVTVDGVRWQDVFEDHARWPRTWSVVTRGGLALGHGGTGCGVVRPRNTTHISLPGYLEIFTGHRTTCMSNVCPQVREATILDVAAAAGVATASISSWDVMDHAASRRRIPAIGDRPGPNVPFVSAGTHWPGPRPVEDPRLEAVAAQGEKAPPFPATGGTYRPDRLTTAIALEYLRVRRPRLFHVGLGDTDEFAHRDDRAGYEAGLRTIDAFLGDLAAALDTLGLWRTTTVLVVSDHGRASIFYDHGPSYPESGRSFLLAFGGAVSAKARGEACATRDLWLTDVAPTLRALLGLPREASLDAVGSVIEDITR
jgi:hypothetical protein